MIPVTLYFVYLVIVLFCAGSIACFFLRKISGDENPQITFDREAGDLSSILILGLIFITTLVSFVSLAHPIDLKVHIAVSVFIVCAGARALWSFAKTFPSHSMGIHHWTVRLAGACCLGIMIFVATDKVAHYDTGLYHAQLVKWTKEFGVVPGLANLQGRFGFNSAWDVFASYLDQSYFSGHSSNVVGLLIAAIFLLACFQGFQRLLDGNRSCATFLRCAAIVVLLDDYRLLLSSLSTEWPSSLLLYYVMIITVERIERGQSEPNSTTNERAFDIGLAASVCVFATTIKLSSLPIVLFLPLWLYLSENKTRTIAMILVPSVLVIVPFVTRNVILTGYLVYPFAAIDLFGVDWKVPPIDVDLMRLMVKYWAINPVSEWYRAADMGLLEQIQTWYKWRGQEAISILRWIFLGIAAWSGILISRRVWRRHDFISLCGIGAISGTGIVFCLLNAPEPRFVAGWCLAFALLPSVCFIHILAGTSFSMNSWRFVGFFLMMASALWMIRHAGIKRMIVHKGTPLWKIAGLPTVAVKEVQTEDGVAIRIPMAGDQVWDAPLPTTTPLALNPWLQMRGQTLKNGFRVTKGGFGIGKESLHVATSSMTTTP